MSADAYIVANLNLIIELYTFFDYCIAQGATVNTGIGANFDIVTD